MTKFCKSRHESVKFWDLVCLILELLQYYNKLDELTAHRHLRSPRSLSGRPLHLIKAEPGSAFIKPDQHNPWIKDQLGNALLSTIVHLQLPNFVSCGRDKPSHVTQNWVTVGAKL